MYFCRLGVLATYMSSPFVTGFMTGSAVQIIIAQVGFYTVLEFWLTYTLIQSEETARLDRFLAEL